MVGSVEQSQETERAGMGFHTDGHRIRDPQGRQRVFHGINLVCKGRRSSSDEGTFTDRGFRGEWTSEDIADLAARGFTLVRLGVIWAALEPRPGEYDAAYLAWLREQLDTIHAAGMYALLDAHQDLYSQAFSDGAPNWATLTSVPYQPAPLWSDDYLANPAVHEALDAFWANAPGPGGVGLQDRFVSMWTHVATELGDHPAVLGYDILNEPTPGTPAQEIFGAVLHAFARATGQELERLIADFAHPERKFAQLAHLEDAGVHRAIGDAVGPLLRAFESEAVHPLMARVAHAIREAGGRGLIAREHNYFANLGIPSGQPPLEDPAWVYSPHGYDLTVDTEAIAAASNIRAGTIFARCRETAARLGVPVIAGEWGALTLRYGIAGHATFLLDTFDSYGWSWTYWVWEEGFAGSEAARALTRPRPLAFAGDAHSWSVSGGGFTARWHGARTGEPSVFFIPGLEARVTRDGQEVALEVDGPWVRIPAGEGEFELRADA